MFCRKYFKQIARKRRINAQACQPQPKDKPKEIQEERQDYSKYEFHGPDQWR
jgi:hypothetical protein